MRWGLLKDLTETTTTTKSDKYFHQKTPRCQILEEEEEEELCDMEKFKKKNGIVKLKNVAEKLHKSFLLGKKSNSSFLVEQDDVPEDVKEGHFAVLAEYGEESRRFVVPLSYLRHPGFLVLLEQAAEEYGFDREGALKVPCIPSELERILADQQWQQGGSNNTVKWDGYEATVQSY